VESELPLERPRRKRIFTKRTYRKELKEEIQKHCQEHGYRETLNKYSGEVHPQTVYTWCEGLGNGVKSEPAEPEAVAEPMPENMPEKAAAKKPGVVFCFYSDDPVQLSKMLRGVMN